MANSPMGTEILVHISAPCAAIDDKRYRALAQSYIDYQPTKARQLGPLLDPVSNIGFSGASSGYDRHSQVYPHTFEQYDSASLGNEATPSPSFRSEMDNLDSPRLPVVPRSTPREYQALQHQAGYSPSRAKPRRLLGPGFSSPSSPWVPASHQFGHSSDSSAPGFTEARMRQSQRATEEQLPSSVGTSENSTTICSPGVVIPCTPLSTQRHMVQKQKREGNNLHHRLISSDNVIIDVTMSTIQETPIALSSNRNDRASDDPTLFVRTEPKKLREEQAGNAHMSHLLRSNAPHFADYDKVVVVDFLPQHGYTYESLEVFSSEPPVAVTPFPSSPEHLITPQLKKLARDLDLSKRFRPRRQQKRDLHPFERECWLLDTTALDDRLKRDAWAFLTNYIATGVAGWGVWCRRNAEYTWIRIYCWGYIAPHIYFLLYLATRRRILYIWSVWVDGEGDRVITMRIRGL
ncbi:Uu.00g098660.m01.CDS01 [Anthostomella pinea]|uniref:Uu.00g098660.m01.CDS01 n=1 Tax=Anthostomella pinea TaxID=933095 RepID=A0AAI8YF60_9PEZI|nr:Uu.00g098660.m01.CDS01 [Anthostomella pinea]